MNNFVSAEGISLLIREVEGFLVEVVDASGVPVNAGDYPFTTRAADTATIDEWRTERFSKAFPGASVRVINPFGDSADGATLLAELRSEWAKALKENRPALRPTSPSGEFFIVDNSDEHWKALEYLRQWCQISEAVDIATGYFEIGSLLALDGEWQKVDKIRILIGSETSRQTVDAIRKATQELDGSFGSERNDDPFLTGLESVVEAMRSGKIEIRVYRKKKFHAKAYITHGRLEVVGSAALVGSSNFTKPGLSQNVELNVRFTGLEVGALQDWFSSYWEEAETATAELLEIMEKHNRAYSPFEVYAKALQVLTNDVDPSAIEWEKHNSKIYPILAPYQREAYHGLKQRAGRWDGAFLTDGVGLGKTFVGLMLAEYYAVKEHKNVLILATKTGQDAVWEPELKLRIPSLMGEFTNVRVMAHTDLSTRDALERVERLADRVDVVIVDEAHHFRNHGSKGPDEESPKSRWWRLQEICKGKLVFHLTATPINNSLFDFVHEFELFTGQNDDHFAALGVPGVRSHFSKLEKTFGEGNANANIGQAVDLTDFEELLAKDPILEALIVQNSRQYAKLSAKAAGAGEVHFPEPDMPRAVQYQYNIAYSALLTEMEKAFEKKNPLFTLPMYYPLAYSKRSDVDTKVENRQRQIVGLIRTTFLKRFESSIGAFAGSCADLATKIAQWIANNSSEMPDHRDQVEEWWLLQSDLINKVHEKFRPGVEIAALDFSEGDDNDSDLLDEDAEDINLADYDLEAMLDAAFEDLNQLTSFLSRAVNVRNTGDEKFELLLALLSGGKASKGKDPLVFDPAFAQQKVIVFTEYADTARYLELRLKEAGVADVDRIDGSRRSNRVDMIRRFAPHYNRVSAEERSKLKPLRVLISTDVLSEGVNLQDVTLVVNYDIHWNPVRLMQRIGRVDRRLDMEIEQAIVKENPKTKNSRGTIMVRNFLPPDALNNILSLYSRVQSRVLLISKTLGIPGGRLLDENDMLDDTKVFKAFLEDYQGDISPTEQLRLDYLDLIAKNPGLGEVLDEMPAGVHAARSGPTPGIFTCTIEPVRVHGDDDAPATWTVDTGQPRWAFHSAGATFGDVVTINSAISCDKNEPSASISDRVAVAAVLKQARKDRHAELMKIGLPLDAPAPLTICWMEVQ